MAEVYATLIMKKRKKLSDVPKRLQDAVKKVLENRNYTDYERKKYRNWRRTENQMCILHAGCRYAWNGWIM